MPPVLSRWGSGEERERRRKERGKGRNKEFPGILNYIKLICINSISTWCHIISIFKGDWGKNVSTGVKVGTNYSGI